jgi:hypothetical protein
MIQFSPVRRCVRRSTIAMCVGLLTGWSAAVAQQASPAPMATMQGMAHMAGHMYVTTLRPLQPGDQQKADAIVADAKAAMAPYQDYQKALADGYEIFLPNVPQPIYHFTRHDYGLEARTHFDPTKPTSLLYTKTADGGYKLVGAMYTDRVDASEEELNGRVPLSIAQWHQHCAARLPRARPAKRRAGFSIRTSLDGWFMCIRTKPTRRRSGRSMTTTRGTTTWIARRCRA